jgi:antitoxin component YwqK of YwqJK toxin-antitoxin module
MAEVVKTYFKNGKLRQECNYMDGKIVGNCYIYKPNGEIKEHRYYIGGRIHGEIIKYYKDRPIM